jgi:uncharacterized protein (DUF362 family)
MYKVVVAESDDPYEGTMKALERLPGVSCFNLSSKILVKPNYVSDDPPESGVTTNPWSVRAVCDYLMESGFKPEDITVGEGGISTYNTMETFKKIGLVDALENTGIRLVDLNSEEHVDVEIGELLRGIRIAKSYLTHDTIISCAKLKVHSLAVATLSMKNMMGGIVPKNFMHTDIHEKIAELNKAFTPKLCVVEGVVGGQTHELACDPVPSRVVIVSNNPVACDAVGAYLMGIDPQEVLYLKIANKAGLGTYDLYSIDIDGDI